MAEGMSFVQAHDFQKPALWIGSAEEFLLNPESGIVWWRSRSDEQVQHGDSWQALPPDRAIPPQGWTHGPSCDCEFCH